MTNPKTTFQIEPDEIESDEIESDESDDSLHFAHSCGSSTVGWP